MDKRNRLDNFLRIISNVSIFCFLLGCKSNYQGYDINYSEITFQRKLAHQLYLDSTFHSFMEENYHSSDRFNDNFEFMSKLEEYFYFFESNATLGRIYGYCSQINSYPTVSSLSKFLRDKERIFIVNEADSNTIYGSFAQDIFIWCEYQKLTDTQSLPPDKLIRESKKRTNLGMFLITNPDSNMVGCIIGQIYYNSNVNKWEFDDYNCGLEYLFLFDNHSKDIIAYSPLKICL